MKPQSTGDRTDHSLHESPLARFSPDVVRLTEDAYGQDSQAVLEALTKPVSTYFVRSNTIKISAGELRRRLVDMGLTVSQYPAIPEALGIRVEGPFAVSSTGKEMVVDKYAAEAVLQGANVYAPGIMASDSVHMGDPVALVSEMGDLLASGTALMNTDEILKFRKGLAVRITERRYNAPQIRELPEFSQGLLYPQSLAAMAASRILQPQPGETILDMNCSPGGKLTHISQLMRNSGRILGLDRNAEKIETTRKTITTLGCSNATLSIADSRYADVDFADLKPDRVIVDPPCSALGLRPKIYDLTTQRKVDNLVKYQKQFIKAASRVVKPGGVVVYSVCTYTTQECEEVVRFAEDQCGLQRVNQTPTLTPSRPQGTEPQCQRFHPVLNEIGYFIAKFIR
jgi:16S rRNA (cytosine967-C5)-methyltransferase